MSSALVLCRFLHFTVVLMLFGACVFRPLLLQHEPLTQALATLDQRPTRLTPLPAGFALKREIAASRWCQGCADFVQIFACGRKPLGSSRLPTLTAKYCESFSFLSNSGTPHSAQKSRATRRPFAETVQYSFGRPFVIVTSLDSITITWDGAPPETYCNSRHWTENSICVAQDVP